VWQDGGSQKLYIVGEHRDMAYDVLPVRRVGLVATLYIELRDEAVCRIT
jgi:hypothetical protein